jgi:hypothetical protein
MTLMKVAEAGVTMPVTSEWYNDEKTILMIKYDGVWTLDDYYQNFKVATDMMETVEHNVVTILDFSSSGQIPVQFLTVGNHSERARAKNNIQIIIFGVNRYMEVLAGMFQRIFPNATRDMKIAGSLEEAIRTAEATLSEEVC